jgi:hypothetical protein
MSRVTALDILYNHAARNISPQTTLHIARLALLHRENHPIVNLAKNMVNALETEAWSAIIRDHFRLPPKVHIPKIVAMLPIVCEWGTSIPRDVLTLALHDAIVCEEPLETVRCLVDAGACVNTIHETSYFSPLMIAARKGRKDVVEMLLRAGARKDFSVDGHTACSLATDPDIISLLS